MEWIKKIVVNNIFCKAKNIKCMIKMVKKNKKFKKRIKFNDSNLFK